MNPHLPKSRSFGGAGEVFIGIVAAFVAVAILVVVLALAVMWLVPVATAGAVVLGFWQSVAIIGLMSVVAGMFKPMAQKK